MKPATLLTIGAVGVGIYLLTKAQPSIADSTQYGGGSDFIPPNNGSLRRDAGPQVVTARTPSGGTKTQIISTPAEGVAFINSNIGNLQTPAENLIRQNTTFSDGQGNTYRTGSNQTVDRLANGQVKVLTVKSVPKSESFFQKPIRVINGKRTRVY